MTYIIKTSFQQMSSKFQANQQNHTQQTGSFNALAKLRHNLVKGWILIFFQFIQAFSLNNVLNECEKLAKGMAFQILNSEINFIKGFRKYPERKVLIMGLINILFDVNAIKLMG